MSEIELAPLSERLEDDELRILQRLLDQAGAKYSGGEDGASHMIAARLTEDAMTEFLDRLEAHDLAADIYLPVEFEGRLNVGDYRVASAHLLVEVLEELKEELDVEEDEDPDEEEEGKDDTEEEGSVVEAQLRNIWQLVTDACQESLEKNLPLHLRV